jgi:hypothetical protein
MEKNSCEFQGRIFPNGSVTCIGDQCIQCSDGNWGPNEFELKFREKIHGPARIEPDRRRIPEMEQSDCVYGDERYPNGSELCAEDECMRCESGQWVRGEFDVGYGY